MVPVDKSGEMVYCEKRIYWSESAVGRGTMDETVMVIYQLRAAINPCELYRKALDSFDAENPTPLLLAARPRPQTGPRPAALYTSKVSRRAAVDEGEPKHSQADISGAFNFSQALCGESIYFHATGRRFSPRTSCSALGGLYGRPTALY